MLNDVPFIWLGLIGSPDNISFFVLIPLRFNARPLISFNCSLRHVQTSPRLISKLLLEIGVSISNYDKGMC